MPEFVNRYQDAGNNHFSITILGNKFDWVEIEKNVIDIRDILWGLPRIPRYCAQVKEMVSVGWHTLIVYNYVWQIKKNPSIVLEQHALLHDASEAYTGDLPGPLKPLIPDFKAIEDRITDRILKSFSVIELTTEEKLILKEADRLALHTECRMIPPSIDDVTKDLKSLFLAVGIK